MVNLEISVSTIRRRGTDQVASPTASSIMIREELRLTRRALRRRKFDSYWHRQEHAVFRLRVDTQWHRDIALDTQTLARLGHIRVDGDVDSWQRLRLVCKVVLDECRVCVDCRRRGVPEN